MLICPKCSHDNELGRIFCHACGAKLDLTQIKAPGQGGPKLKRKRQGSLWRVVRSLIELAVLCAVLYAVYLVWQVPPHTSTKPSNADLLALEDRRFDLDRLVMHNQPGKLEISEKEINSYLSSLVMEQPPAAWLVFMPETVQMELREGNVKIKLWGELRFGQDVRKKLYISYICIPELQEGTLENKPLAATFGFLPIHPLILENTTAVQRYIGAIFEKLDRDRATLQKFSSIVVHRGHATLEYQPKAEAKPGGTR